YRRDRPGRCEGHAPYVLKPFFGPNGPGTCVPVTSYLPRVVAICGDDDRGLPLIVDEAAAAVVTPSPPTAGSEHFEHQPKQAPALAGVELGAPWRPDHGFGAEAVPDRHAFRGEH